MRFSHPFFTATTEGDNPPAPSPAPAATPTPTPAPADDDAKVKLAEFEQAKKELEAAQKKLGEYAKKEQEEIDKQKSAEQKLAEKEAEIARLSREAMVERVRRANGFGDKVYDVVAAKGDTEEDVKASFEAYKANLEEYIKAQGVKPPAGSGTDGGGKPKGQEANKGNQPYLVKLGLVKPAGSQAV